MSKATKPITKVEEAAAGKFNVTTLGANIITTIKNDAGEVLERYAKKVTTEEREKIVKKILLYNKKPSDTLKAQIVDMLTPETKKAKAKEEKINVAKKGVEKLIKKEKKVNAPAKAEEKGFLDSLEDFLASDEKAVDKLQAVLDKFKKVKVPEAEVRARLTTNPSSGEKYRNGHRVTAYYAMKDGRKMEVDRDGYLIGEW